MAVSLDQTFSSRLNNYNDKHRSLQENIITYIRNTLLADGQLRSYSGLLTGGYTKSPTSVLDVDSAPGMVKDSGKRYSGINHESTSILYTIEPVATMLKNYISDSESTGLSTLYNMVSHMAHKGDNILPSTIMRDTNISSNVTRMLRPSALLSLLTDLIHHPTGIVEGDEESKGDDEDSIKTEKYKIMEYHPGNGELLLACGLLSTMPEYNIEYTGIEPSSKLLAEDYEPIGDIDYSRKDLRGIFDTISPPTARYMTPRILTKIPEDELFDIIILRKPKSLDEIENVIKKLTAEGILIIIPEELQTKYNYYDGVFLSDILASGILPSPELVGIQTTTNRYVGAIVYKNIHSSPPSSNTLPILKIPPLKIPKLSTGSSSVINHGARYVDPFAIIGSSIKDINETESAPDYDRIVIISSYEDGSPNILRKSSGLPVHVFIPNQYSSRYIPIEGVSVIHVASMQEAEQEAKNVADMFIRKGESVLTDLYSDNVLDSIINTIKFHTKAHTSKTIHKLKTPRTIMVSGSCNVLTAAISLTFPTSTIHTIMPEKSKTNIRLFDIFSKRKSSHFYIHNVTSEYNMKDSLEYYSKKFTPDIIWRLESQRQIYKVTKPLKLDTFYEKDAKSQIINNRISKHIKLRTLLSPSEAYISKIPYNIISTCLFRMDTSKQYRSFNRYLRGVSDTIRIIKTYLNDANFVLRIYTDDSITKSSVYKQLYDICKKAECVEIIEYYAPSFRSTAKYGHASTFGTLVRLMPLFDFSHSGGGESTPGEVGIVSIRDLDINFTEGQTYDDFAEFIRNESYDVLAYTNGYNPLHMKHIPRSHHDAVFGAGSMSFKTRFDRKIFDNFLDDILNMSSSLHAIIKPTISESRRGFSSEGSIYYGVDELLMNHILLHKIPKEKLMIVKFYDEPYYLIKRIYERYIPYASDEKRQDALQDIQTRLKTISISEKVHMLSELLEKYKSYIPLHEYNHNTHYDISKTYEKVMI